MDAQYPVNDMTTYFNILITDGPYLGYSTDAQVMAELQQMYNAGITAHVIGFGDGVNAPQMVTEMNNMANWGYGATCRMTTPTSRPISRWRWGRSSRVSRSTRAARSTTARRIRS